MAKKKTEKFDTRIPVYDLKGKVVDNIQLDEKLFDGKVNKTLLYEAKKMYEANSRKGTVSTKTRGEVSGGGIKPWRQKGTGRARVGSSRNPLWRHGGVSFGPKARDHGYTMPKKAMKKALLSSLNARLTENMLKSVIKIELKEAKTKVFVDALNALKVEGKSLVVVDELTSNVNLSVRNIKGASIKEGRNLNARDVLVNDCLIIEKEALKKLAERLR